jgi:hypothetical protein
MSYKAKHEDLLTKLCTFILTSVKVRVDSLSSFISYPIVYLALAIPPSVVRWLGASEIAGKTLPSALTISSGCCLFNFSRLANFLFKGGHIVDIDLRYPHKIDEGCSEMMTKTRRRSELTAHYIIPIIHHHHRPSSPSLPLINPHTKMVAINPFRKSSRTPNASGVCYPEIYPDPLVLGDKYNMQKTQKAFDVDFDAPPSSQSNVLTSASTVGHITLSQDLVTADRNCPSYFSSPNSTKKRRILAIGFPTIEGNRFHENPPVPGRIGAGIAKGNQCAYDMRWMPFMQYQGFPPVTG